MIAPGLWMSDPSCVLTTYRELYRGIKHIIPIWSGTSAPYDIITNTTLSIAAGTPIIRVGTNGTETFMENENEAWEMTIPTNHRISNFPYSIAVFTAPFNNSTEGAVLDLADTTTNSRNINILLGGAGRDVGFVMRNGTYSPSTSTEELSIGQYAMCAATFRSQTSAELWVDGKSVLTNNFNAGAFTPDRLSIGRFGDSTPSNSLNDVAVAVAYVWDRQLTQSDAILLTKDPFGILRQSPRGFEWVERRPTIRVRARGRG